MRVLVDVAHLRRAVPGGIGTYARGLLSGLVALGAEAPEVALLAGRSAKPVDPLARYGWPVLGRRWPPWLLARAWDRGWVGPPEGYDVVHSVALGGPPRRRTPLTIMVHDLAWRSFPDAFPARGRRWHESALRRAIVQADALVAPSRQTADALVAAGARPDAVSVVEEGSDHLPAPDVAGAARLLDHLGVGGDYILSVGTLEPRKNLERLLEAYAMASSRMSVRLVVVGPPGWGPGLASSQGVTAAGPVDDGVLSGLLRGARALVYVPLHEGFGLPVVEAMAAGVPVVSSAVPAAGGASLEVDPLDAAGIADALVDITADEELRARLCRAGSLRVTGLRWEATARRHIEVWERART